MSRIRLREQGLGVTRGDGLIFQSDGIDGLGRLRCDTIRRYSRDPSDGTCGQDGGPPAGVRDGLTGFGA